MSRIKKDGGRESGGTKLVDASNSKPAAAYPAVRITALTKLTKAETERVLTKRIRELEDAERTCKAANESQRKTIAELEAELAEWREFLSRDSYGGSLKNALERARKAEARAERAEAELDETNDAFEHKYREVSSLREKAEARVKWLEDPKNWVDEYGQPDEGTFAREREAD